MSALLSPQDVARAVAISIPSGEAITRKAIHQIAEITGVTPAEICGIRRYPHFCEARDLAAYVAHREGASYTAIGRVMRRDPSSICDAVHREQKRRAKHEA